MYFCQAAEATCKITYHYSCFYFLGQSVNFWLPRGHNGYVYAGYAGAPVPKVCYTKIMYAGVDIGGTKTLLASLDEQGVITEQTKFPTPPIYANFLEELAKAVETLTTKEWQAAGVAFPGRIDRQHGIGQVLGNLPWKDVPIQADTSKIFGCPVAIENDANLAGLSEAMLHREAETVLYVTVSTGIGTGVIQHQAIENPDNHPEGGNMLLPFQGKLEKWETFASGHAIVETYGQRAADITDPKIWQAIAHNLGLGFLELIAIVQPNLIVIGGSIGTYLDHYKDFLEAELKRYETPLVPIPPIVQAQRPETAVVYGCYDYAKAVYG